MNAQILNILNGTLTYNEIKVLPNLDRMIHLIRLEEQRKTYQVLMKECTNKEYN